MNQKYRLTLRSAGCLVLFLLLAGLIDGQAVPAAGGWVMSNEPPQPVITAGGIAVETTSPGYSWCKPADNAETMCMNACGALPNQLPTVTVPAGSEIVIQEPEGIDTLTLSHWNGEYRSGDAASYLAPSAPGTYSYILNAEWQLNQGKADYFFALTVE